MKINKQLIINNIQVKHPLSQLEQVKLEGSVVF